MPHDFDVDTLASIDASACLPGNIVWALSGHELNLQKRLILRTIQDTEFLAVDLEGDREFQVRYGRMPSAGEVSLLPLNSLPMKIELPDSPKTSGDSVLLGGLAINEDGAFICVQGEDGHGFNETRFVSVRDWTLHIHLSGRRTAVFPAWRLTTSETNSSERRVIYTHGDW